MAKKTITITLHLSEILYDVYNKTYLVGKNRAEGDNFAQVSMMQADEDEENKNQILRSVTNAFAVVKRMVGEYLYDNCVTTSNVLTEEEPMELYLLVPTNFNLSAKENITEAIHQYIVNIAIYDWFIITNKADADTYLALAEANAVNITESLNRRIRPKRPL